MFLIKKKKPFELLYIYYMFLIKKSKTFLSLNILPRKIVKLKIFKGLINNLKLEVFIFAFLYEDIVQKGKIKNKKELLGRFWAAPKKIV